ncbi:MAG: alpha/beta hydrolase [Gemmatimonadales bacterium]
MEYEIRGDGEPVLLIHGSHIAGSYLPLMAEPALADYRLIRYHRRGFAGSTPHEGPFSIEDQAADALAVLRHLGVKRTHVVGHSYGGTTGLQLAVDTSGVVASLVLLEPAGLKVPSAAVFAEEHLVPATEKYELGDPAGAVDTFGRAVGGSQWKAEVSRTVPGGVEQAEDDAMTFFEVELPALAEWEFGAEKATRISQPILFVLGSESDRMVEDARDLIHSVLPQTEDHLVPGAGHLLQMQNPRSVAEGISDFLSRHPL